MQSIELAHPALPELLDELLRQQGWSWQRVEKGEAKINGQAVSLGDLEWFLINADPVIWCECNLVNRPEDGGGLWRLFDYQKPSMRFRGNAVHQDGAEVGKTREIIALIGWCCTGAERGSVLVGSALDGDLDEIWDELQFQIGENPWLASQRDKDTTKPYRRQSFRNGLKVLFRPAGHDGRAYRGVHVRGMLLHDEAAKVVNPRSWAEFWRAAKPGCEIRIYSVPTGDRLCTFQRIADAAADSEKVAALTSPRSIVDGVVGRRAVGEEARALTRELEGRTWVRFHWPKTIMPAPYWSEKRRLEYVDMFGSADDPGYIHNVLGLPGDPEFSVFPSRLLDPVLRFLPDYRTVELIWDSNAQRLDVLVRRLNPQFSDVLEELEGEAEGSAPDPYLVEYRDSLDTSGWHGLAPLERRTWIDSVVRSVLPRAAGGDLTAGVDVGSSSVTEMLFERSVNGVDCLALRIQVRGWDWYAQSLLLQSLDEMLRPSNGWGLDATGVGKSLLDIVQGEGLGDRISGFIFNQVTAAINLETGEPQIDPQTGRQAFISNKELATQLLERALARREKQIPDDPELVHLLQNHTCTDTGGARRYSKRNDHVADAYRCAALRRFLNTFSAVNLPPVAYASLTAKAVAPAMKF